MPWPGFEILLILAKLSAQWSYWWIQDSFNFSCKTFWCKHGLPECIEKVSPKRGSSWPLTADSINLLHSHCLVPSLPTARTKKLSSPKQVELTSKWCLVLQFAGRKWGYGIVCPSVPQESCCGFIDFLMLGVMTVHIVRLKDKHCWQLSHWSSDH